MRGEYVEAIPVARQVVEIHQRTLGPEHPDTLFSLDGLGLLWVIRFQSRQVESANYHDTSRGCGLSQVVVGLVQRGRAMAETVEALRPQSTEELQAELQSVQDEIAATRELVNRLACGEDVYDGRMHGRIPPPPSTEELEQEVNKLEELMPRAIASCAAVAWLRVGINTQGE